jgi:hypothetical protein
LANDGVGCGMRQGAKSQDHPDHLGPAGASSGSSRLFMTLLLRPLPDGRANGQTTANGHHASGPGALFVPN